MRKKITAKQDLFWDHNVYLSFKKLIRIVNTLSEWGEKAHDMIIHNKVIKFETLSE